MPRLRLRPLLAAALLLALPGTAAHAEGPVEKPVEQVEIRSQNGTERMWYRLDGKWFDCCAITRIDAGTPLFHWGSPQDIDRWSAQGKVDASEVKWLSETGYGAAGGGFYVSLSATDSMNYGTAAVMAQPEHSFAAIEHDECTVDNQNQQNVNFSSATDTHSILLNYFVVIPEELRAPVTPEAPWLTQAVFPLLTGHMLRAAGIQAIKYEATWINLVGADPLTQVKTLTPERFLRNYVKADTPMSEFFQFDSRFPFASSPALKQVFPSLDSILHGKPIPPAQRASLFNRLFDATHWNNSGAFTLASARDTPLVASMKKYFRVELLAWLQRRLQISQMPAGETVESVFTNIFPQLLAFGFRGSDVLPETHVSRARSLFKSSDEIDRTMAPGVSIVWPGLDDYATHLQQAFRVAQIYDVAAAIAAGSPAPWSINDAIAVRPLVSYLTFLDTSQKAADQTYLQYYQQLVTGTDAFRPGPLLTTGEEMLDGLVAPGYLKVTEHEYQELTKNPYLVLREKSLAPDSTTLDPAAPAPDAATPAAFHHVQLEHPSARTYTRFRDKLTAELLAELDAAQASGALADPASPQFSDLTAKILSELLRRLDAGLEGWNDRGVKAAAIAPFGPPENSWFAFHLYEGANEFARVDPLSGLLSTGTERTEELLNDVNRQVWIQKALSWAYIKGNHDASIALTPELWQAVLEIPKLPADPAAMVSQALDFFRSPEIRQLLVARRYNEVRQRVYAAFPLTVATP